MNKIQIEIEYPLTFLLLALACVGGYVVLDTLFGVEGAHMGGEGHQMRAQVVSAEQEIDALRTEQRVLERQEEILRFEFAELQREIDREGAQWSADELSKYQSARDRLIELLTDKTKAEQAIKMHLQQIWEAEGRMRSASMEVGDLRLSWPVDASVGLSAGFKDAAYEERFGIPHHGIDIPVVQGTLIRAAADGVVESAVDNGLGFNAVVLRHAGGATLYGHVTTFLVSEGDFVRRGDPIARSGGRPGSPGAGALSTGPHLHFEVSRGGEKVDPMEYLIH